MLMSPPLSLWVASCLALGVLPVAAHADLYGYVDTQGTYHFSSAQVDTRYTRYIPAPSDPQEQASRQMVSDQASVSRAVTGAMLSYKSPVTLAQASPPRQDARFNSEADRDGTTRFSTAQSDNRDAFQPVHTAPGNRTQVAMPAQDKPLIVHRSHRVHRHAARYLLAGHLTSHVLPAALNFTGRRSISNLKSDRLPIVTSALHPTQPMRFDTAVRRAAQKFGLARALIHSVIDVESHYRVNAVSARGATGLMQLMPATARQYGARDIFDPVQNILAGAGYMKALMDRFNGNIVLAVAAYNAGEGSVMRYGNQVPPYKETENYVTAVLTRYRKLMFG